MSQAANALISADEYRQFVNQEGDAGRPEGLIETHIGAASTFIARYCNRTLIKPAAAVDWLFDGNGTVEQYTPDRPIAAQPTLFQWDGTAYVAETGTWTYDAANGVIYFTDGSYFWKGRRNYKLTYLAGYLIAAVPQDLKYACAQMVFRVLRKMVDNQEGIASDSFDGHSTSYDFNKLPPDLRQILNGYRVVYLG